MGIPYLGKAVFILRWSPGYALTNGLFWSLFASKRPLLGQNNTRVSAETINLDCTTIVRCLACLSSGDDVAVDWAMFCRTRLLWSKHVKSDILYVMYPFCSGVVARETSFNHGLNRYIFLAFENLVTLSIAISSLAFGRANYGDVWENFVSTTTKRVK